MSKCRMTECLRTDDRGRLYFDKRMPVNMEIYGIIKVSKRAGAAVPHFT